MTTKKIMTNKSSMKNILMSCSFLLTGVISLCALFSSCSDDNTLPSVSEETKYSFKCNMRLSATKPFYNDVTTRATTSEWEDGSTIYIKFSNGGKSILGMATYSTSTGLWEVACEDVLSVEANDSCLLYYFESAEDINTKGASIGGTTGIYEDLHGQYAFDGTNISVSAKLSPKLGRVRFSGNENDTIMLSGVKRYGYFDASTCTYKLDSTEVLLSATVKEGDKFYTPYYYGAMIEGNKTLKLTDMKDAFARYCSDIFTPGNSGFMKIPHTENFSGWMKDNPLSQNLISINWPDSITEDRKSVILDMINQMVFVEGGSFWMGAQNISSDKQNYNASCATEEGPVHKVILSPFYIGQTELTEQQWAAVCGGNSVSKIPHYWSFENYNSSSCSIKALYFIEQLKAITQLNFDIPTEAEWEYAARGGKNTKYNLFAGTNSSDSHYFGITNKNIDEVRRKYPNEIGLYDMTGNVAELCKYIGDYNSSTVINPRWDYDQYNFRGSTVNDFYYQYAYSSGSNRYNAFSLTRRKTNSGYNYGSYSYPDYVYNYSGVRIVLRLLTY